MRVRLFQRRSSLLFLPMSVILIIVLSTAAADTKPSLSAPAALSPREELATFRVPKGFRVELAAQEPAVVDPVAIAFDENGRLFVAEMRGYPNAGVATGRIHSGSIKLLEDRDGDGFYETSTVFAEGLRFPTSVMPWKGGLLVAVAPDLVYFEDTDGDGRADRHRSLYTGFNLDNIQQLVNSLQWGLDNWVYGCAGSNGGTVHSVEKPNGQAITLRNRGIRFHPEQPDSLEPTSGGGQFGLAADDGQQWFTATNSQHLRHIVFPDHYLRRNPSLPVREVTIDIPDHDAACEVHRISPFEAWRVERTRRRRDGPDAQRFPSTELVPGGYITSACSPVVYTADLFLPKYRSVYVCDPANNLVHRDVLEPLGATYVAKRGEADSEFLASTDNWFRPVNLTIGPEGALYVVDFYREVIETPLSLPDDIKQKLNLESRGRGRIWRIVPEGFQRPKKPALGKASAEELVKHLGDPNPWWRLTAQRLLVERQDQAAVRFLADRLATSAPLEKVHLLWTLHGLHALTDAQIERALADSSDLVRTQALRLAEERLASAELRKAVSQLAPEASPRARFQLALTLGAAEGPETLTALAKVVHQGVKDSWMQLAILSSCAHTAPDLLTVLAHDPSFVAAADTANLQFLTRLATLAATTAKESELARVLDLLAPQGAAPQAWQIALLDGLGQGLHNSQRNLRDLWEHPSPALKAGLEKARPFFQRAAVTAQNEKVSLADRLAAARLLGYGPYAVAASALEPLLSPRNPTELQLAGIRALSIHENSNIAGMLLNSWGSYSPVVRREVLEALFARSERLPYLLNAIEQKKVLAGQLEPFRLEQLRKHANVRLRQRALTLLAGQLAPDRQKVVDAYKPALDLKADNRRGKVVFKKTCSTCHRLENEGMEVGPDLLSALRNKSRDTLLIDILDPSREVDPRYINYVVSTKSGRMLSGMIAAETASSITLRRAEKAEDTLLRNQIDEIQATSKSLMPENLEMQLSKQDMADLIAYLQSVAAPR